MAPEIVLPKVLHALGSAAWSPGRMVNTTTVIVVDDHGIGQKIHWNSGRSGTISYPTDEDYEQHFLTLFGESVNRRTSADALSLVHLSGDMDSSSIMCVADPIARKSTFPNPMQGDTLSNLDSSEPNSDQLPIIHAVETNRKKVGVHLELSLSELTFAMPRKADAQYLLPGLDSS